MHFLITAGGTREYIDPVRFISNASSGRMGYALARAAIEAGHKVTLITTVKNSEFRIQNSELKVVNVETAKEMFVAVKKLSPVCDCLIMAAAVADYTPVKKSKIKIKKAKKNLIIRLKPTVDILAWAGKHKYEPRATRREPRFVVGFALEDKAIRTHAEKKLKDKNLDMIIVNTPATIGTDRTTIHIKTAKTGWTKMENITKIAAAKKIIALLAR